MAIIRTSTGVRTRRSATSFDRQFEALYGRHWQALSRYCQALVKDEHDAVDLLQNVAVRAMLALRRGAQPERERAWLYAIAHNEAMSLLRRRRLAPPLDERLIAPAADPLPTILMREHLAELWDDVHELTPRARRMLLMRELSGLGRADIAAALGVSPGAVSQSLSESRAALRVDRAARDLPCHVVRSLLDESDRRRRTPRTVRAHLRGCQSCRDWARRGRRSRIAAIVLTPAPALLRWLESSLAGGPASGLLTARSPAAGAPRALALLASITAGAVGMSAMHQRTRHSSPAGPALRTSRGRPTQSVSNDTRVRAYVRLAAGGMAADGGGSAARYSVRMRARLPSAAASARTRPATARPVSRPRGTGTEGGSDSSARQIAPGLESDRQAGRVELQVLSASLPPSGVRERSMAMGPFEQGSGTNRETAIGSNRTGLTSFTDSTDRATARRNAQASPAAQPSDSSTAAPRSAAPGSAGQRDQTTVSDPQSRSGPR